MATNGNPLTPLNTHVATNARMGDNLNPVASAQRNIAHRYSTQLGTQLVHDLSAEEELKRL